MTGRGTGRFLPFWFRARPSLQCQCRCVLLTLYRAVFTPYLDLLGVDMGLLVVEITECDTRRAVPLFLHGVDKESSKWAPNWGSASKGDIQQGRQWKRWSPSVISWTVWGVWNLWVFQLGYSGSQWDIPFLSCSGGQHFIHIAKGNCRGDTPGRQPDWVSWAHLKKTSWKVEAASSAIWACSFWCFLANLICQSLYFIANTCISWANFHSSWTLAWLMPCNCCRDRWKSDLSSILEPSSLLGWGATKELIAVLAWLWWQKVVTMPRFPFSTPSVTKIAMWMASPLIFWPLLVTNSTPAFPHIAGDVKQAKSLWNDSESESTNEWEFSNGHPLLLQ